MPLRNVRLTVVGGAEQVEDYRPTLREVARNARAVFLTVRPEGEDIVVNAVFDGRRRKLVERVPDDVRSQSDRRGTKAVRSLLRRRQQAWEARHLARGFHTGDFLAVRDFGTEIFAWHIPATFEQRVTLGLTSFYEKRAASAGTPAARASSN